MTKLQRTTIRLGTDGEDQPAFVVWIPPGKINGQFIADVLRAWSRKIMKCDEVYVAVQAGNELGWLLPDPDLSRGGGN